MQRLSFKKIMDKYYQENKLHDPEYIAQSLKELVNLYLNQIISLDDLSDVANNIFTISAFTDGKTEALGRILLLAAELSHTERQSFLTPENAHIFTDNLRQIIEFTKGIDSPGIE